MGKYDQQKRGLFARFRSTTKNRGSGKHQQQHLRSSAEVTPTKPDQRESSSSPTPNTTLREESPASVTMPHEKRIVSPEESNNPNTMKIRKRSKLPYREEIALDHAPTAEEAAFGGPPRYDWIDIVSPLSLLYPVLASCLRLAEEEATGHRDHPHGGLLQRRNVRGLAREPPKIRRVVFVAVCGNFYSIPIPSVD